MGRGSGTSITLGIRRGDLSHYGAGATSREVGELIEGMNSSAIAKSYQRFAKQVETDQTLQQEVEGLWRAVSNVQI